MLIKILSSSIIDSYLDSTAKQVAVAVSGGLDSMCLTYLLNTWCAEHECKLYALIVDHGLRAESKEEAESVKQYLSTHNIDTQILLWQSDKPASNIHKIAREARYNLLIDFCKKHNIKHLFVAHTKDDQAETILLRIYRGSGIDGITGMEAISSHHDINIIRPLLDFKKDQLAQYAKQVGLWWVEDPSNANIKFDRVKMRQALQLIENKFNNDIFVNRLLLLADNARRAKKFLARITNEYIAQHVIFSELGYTQVKSSLFFDIEEELGLRILVKILRKIGGKSYPPRLESTKHLLDALRSKNFKGKTLWGCEVATSRTSVIFFREINDIPKEVKLMPNTSVLWDNRYSLQTEFPAIIRPLGKPGWEKLNAIGVTPPEVPLARIIHTLPALYDEHGKLISVLHLKLGSVNT